MSSLSSPGFIISNMVSHVMGSDQYLKGREITVVQKQKISAINRLQ